jgi:AcrR family transcriptional regulator
MTDEGPRARILRTVTALFIEKGYHGTAIQDISVAVGLGRGALYHHIGSKEQLLQEISLALLRDATDATRPAAASDDPPDVKLRSLARALLRHHAENGDGWSVALREARFLSEEHRATVLAARDEFEALWRTVLDQGAAAGLWRQVDDVDVRGILGMFNSAARWLDPHGALTPEEIADRYVDMLLHGLDGGARRTGAPAGPALQS